jgi:hypothetical protein
MARTTEQLRKQRPHRLVVAWCDRCRRAVNANDEPAHRHEECCEHCDHFRMLAGADGRGRCANRLSVYAGRQLHGDDACSKWEGVAARGTSEPIDGTWCDRCHVFVEDRNAADHFHEEQCGGCLRFKAIDGDWGYCRSHESVYAGRLMFEHDTCSEWETGGW